MDYQDAVISKLIEKFEAEGPAELSGKYRYGDILIAPKSELPICTIAKTGTNVMPASNMEDQHMMSMVINVIYDYTQDLTQDHDIIAGVNSLYDLIEGRDSNYQLKPDSLLYILRKYQTLDNNLWISVGPQEQTQVAYGIGSQRRGPGIFSIEAAIRFTVRADLSRPGL